MHNVLKPEQVSHIREMNFDSWPDRLRYAVALSGVSQAQIARVVELPAPNVSQILAGRQKTVSLQTALRFAKLLGLTVEELFPDVVDPTSAPSEVEAR